jgi:hypothetical protein
MDRLYIVDLHVSINATRTRHETLEQTIFDITHEPNTKLVGYDWWV